jgi:hypothetical protein
MFKGVIYISSTNRSGSTLLDLLLGGHQEITSLGEVHHLGAYIDKPQYSYYNQSTHPKPLSCLCGERVLSCKFWAAVEQQLGCKLIDLQLDPYHIHQEFNKTIIDGINYKSVRTVTNKINRKIVIEYFPHLFLNSTIQKITGYSAIAHDYFKLYRAASRVSESSYVIDSSKTPYRFQYLYTQNPSKIKIILLCRDPKSVVASMVKRGADIFKAIDTWNNMAKRIELFASNIPSEKIIRIRYEDLCRNTENTLKVICNFLELQFKFPSMSPSTYNKHHVGGSPSKFRDDRIISLDETYNDILTSSSIKIVQEHTKKYRNIWGY